MRVVEVWFDDWKKYFYMHKTHLKGMNYGDISKQLALKERLQCKNFSYFMNVVAPDIMQYYPPVEPDPAAMGFVSWFLSARHSLSDYLQVKSFKNEQQFLLFMLVLKATLGNTLGGT